MKDEERRICVSVERRSQRHEESKRKQRLKDADALSLQHEGEEGENARRNRRIERWRADRKDKEETDIWRKRIRNDERSGECNTKRITSKSTGREEETCERE